MALSTAPAAAADDAATAKRHINLSALQGMLVEQISKAACFASVGVNADANLRYMAGAHALFERARIGLRTGNTALGLQPEEHKGMIASLDKLDRDQGLWGAAVTAIGAGSTVSNQLLASLAAVTPNLVASADELALKAERIYGQGDFFPLAVTLKIKLASRQRMLSQRMAKNVCMIEAGIGGEEMRAELQASVALFDSTLEALIDGHPALGLRPEEDATQRHQLDFVRTLWSETQPIYARIAAGGAPTAEDLRLIAWQNNQILSQMNAAVFNYEFLGADS